ncbi:MAG: ATP-dependent RNA helicase RhlE [Actinobacteria bacterium]|nr:ATP-dependent RNA helicase RhlE [Actinomycetota bacterium]
MKNIDIVHEGVHPFSKLGLCEALVSTVAQQGYASPTPIQAQAIPPILEGKDVMGAAQTGTGKTAGFTLPILDRLRSKGPSNAHEIKVLILTPTRELAAQVGDSVSTYGKALKISSAVVFGGVNINPQKRRLAAGVDILVATPGRLLDLAQQNQVRFSRLEVLVLDEADRMLDMGFIHDIRKIISILPKRRQTLLFSATFSNEVRGLAKGIVQSPVEVSVTPENSTVDAIDQFVYPVDKKEKMRLLASLIKQEHWQQVLVFCRTKWGADKVSRRLNQKGISSVAIHGNKTQGARTRALSQFKNHEVTVLVATDIAARGLDISQLPYVVNLDLPNVSEDYVHRIGRTGRAGATGHAVSLVSQDEFALLQGIERLIKKVLPRKTLGDVVSPHHLPASSLDRPSPRFKKGNGSFRGHRKKWSANKRSKSTY